jgi:hypothetical protein
MPAILPAMEASNDQPRTRSTIAQIDSMKECQCHAYHAVATTSATARKRAPMAQPQLSPAFRGAILTGSLARFARRLSTKVRPVRILSDK